MRHLYWVLLAFLLSGCWEKGERFSFTLPFYVMPISEEVFIDDTLWINSIYSDVETNYHTGEHDFIGSQYFNTKIRLYRLGNFNESKNCILSPEEFLFVDEIGEVYLDDSIILVNFEHLDNQYLLSIGLIPTEEGVFALALSDTEEVVKIFINENYHRNLLNEFNIYELNDGESAIPIDERIYFFRVR